ncbi:thiamine phosphate synthase [Oenococcus alcoholitolerans]|uniref:thiamine phosphate synthase n=1 Tax=Oenococcus alcoholitolerans TaxID=931074 RepID=UPI003F713DE0
MKFKKKFLESYYVAGSQNFDGDQGAFLKRLDQACSSGITMFQYREKGPGSLTDPARIDLGKRAKEITDRYQIPFVVDDDLQLAIQLEADGIHIGQKDEPVQQIAAPALKSGMFIGLSVSDPEELQKSGDINGVSYLGSGPVFATSSKKDAHQPIGINGLTVLKKLVKIPIVAIGGINPDNAAEVWKSGIDGISIISAISKSKNPTLDIERMKKHD